MATRDDLIIAISADAANAVKGLEAVQNELKDLNKALSQVKDSTTGMGAAFVKMNAVIGVAKTAFNAFQGTIGKSVQAFVTQNDAVNKVRNTLKLIGEKEVTKAAKGFEEFASQLQENSVVGDEVSLQLISVAKAMRLSDEQTKSLVQTSADLAAVTGKDIKASFDQLTASLKGEAGELTKLDPKLKNMTAEQLKAGAAIEALGVRFAGFAKSQTQTVGGQLKQLENLYGDLLEQIGGLFSDFLGMDQQQAAMSAIKSVIDTIASIRPVVQEVRAEVGEFLQRVVNGFKSMSDGISIVQAALVPLGVALAVAFGPKVIANIATISAQILTYAKNIATASKATLLLAGKIALITAAITAVAVAVEFVIRNFKNLSSIAKDVSSAIFDGMVTVAKAIQQLFNAKSLKRMIFGEAGEVFTEVAAKAAERFDKAFAKVGDSWKKNTENLDFGLAGKAVQSFKEFMGGFNQELEVAVQTQGEMTTAAKETAAAYSSISKEAQAALDNLAKKISELQQKQGELSQNQIVAIEQRSIAEQKNIDLIEKELRERGVLNAETRKQLELARQLVESNKGAEIANVQKKAVEEIIEKNKELRLQIDSMGATQVEIIDMTLARQLELIEKKREELQLQGLLTAEAAKALDKQAALAKESATKTKAAAPTQIQDSLAMGGAAIGKGITDAFAPLMGLTSGVGAAVAAGQAVVDAIPQMLDSITNLITSITELPLKILESLNKLFDAIIKHIVNIIPNLIKAIRGIIQGAIKFLMELPKAVATALAQLPDMLMGLLNELPQMVEDLVEALVQAGPQIALSLIEFMIKDAPKLALKIIEVMAIRLPIAIIKGIIDGFKEVAKGIKKLFSGGGFNLVDPKLVEKQLKDVMKKVSGSASRLFAVVDLAEQAKAAEKAKDLTKGIEKAGTDAMNLLKKAWMWVLEQLQKFLDFLRKAWLWIWENVLEPIFNIVKKAWMWVWQNVLEPIFNLVKAAWDWVWKNVIEPIASLVKDSWDAALKLAHDTFKLIGEGFKASWELIKVYFQLIVDSLKVVWDFIKGVFEFAIMGFKAVWEIFKAYASAAWETLKAAWDGIIAVFKSMWDGLINTLKSAWNAITAIFTNTWEGIKKIWQTLMDIFSGKIGILEGVGKIFGTIFDTAKENLGAVFKVFQTAGEAIGKTFNTAFESLKNVFQTFLDGAGQIGDKIWGAFKALFEKAGDVFAKAGEGIWNSLKKALDGAGDIFKGFGTKIWDSLKGGLETIGDLVKNIFNKISPAAIFEKLFKIPDNAWGTGTVEGAISKVVPGFDIPFIKFAEGGKVPGQPSVPGDSELNDRILALLSPGEIVLSRSQVKLLESIFGDNLVKAALGFKKPKFIENVQKSAAKVATDLGVPPATGGVIGDLFKGDVGSVLEQIDPRNALDIVGKYADSVREKFSDMLLGMIGHFQDGGLVGTDSVPAMLTPGEFVMSRAGVQAAGLGTLQALNGGRAAPQVINYNIEMPVTIKNDGMPVDANFVRQRILPTIEQELKRSSIEGRFVISQRGIRNA